MLAPACVLLSAQFLLAVAAHAETWTEVRSPNFRVVTNGGARDAREVAANFERLNAVLQKTSRISVRADVPLTIVAVKTGRQLKSLIGSTRDDIGGIFAPGHDAQVVLLRLDLDKETRFQVAYHEYMHRLIHQSMGAVPVWLDEGLSELYSQAQLDTDTVLLGMPAPFHLAELQERTLLPLETLLAVDHSSPHYNEGNRASVFYAQSWALTHFLMLGDGGAHRQQLMTLLEALDKGAPPREATLAAFGDVAAFERQFRQYLSRFQFPALKDMVPMANLTKGLPARPLAPAEALALQATVTVTTGEVAQAAVLARDAVAADGTLPEAWMAQARVARRSGDREATTAALEKAIAAGSNDPLAHFGWAEMQLARVPADHPLTDVSAALERALALKPDLTRAMSLLAYVRMRQTREAPPSIELAKKAILLEPGNARHYLMLATVLYLGGDHDAVAMVLARAQALARGEQEKQRVAEAVAQLKPRGA